MIKKLIRHGNSLALVIDRAVLDLLEIEADTLLRISTDGRALIISPVPETKHSDRFGQALENTNKKYGRMLKNLGD